MLAANAALMHGLVVGVGLGLMPAKVATEALLLVVSYAVQRRFVFAGPGEAVDTEPAPSEGSSAGRGSDGVVSDVTPVSAVVPGR